MERVQEYVSNSNARLQAEDELSSQTLSRQAATDLLRSHKETCESRILEILRELGEDTGTTITGVSLTAVNGQPKVTINMSV